MKALLAQVAYGLVLSIGVACISWTIAMEEVFAWFRDALKRFRESKGGWAKLKWYTKMFDCPYCLSHYVAAFFILQLNFKMMVGDWRGYIVAEFFIVYAANIFSSLYNCIRAWLRERRAMADSAELLKKRLEDTPARTGSAVELARAAAS